MNGGAATCYDLRPSGHGNIGTGPGPVKWTKKREGRRVVTPPAFDFIARILEEIAAHLLAMMRGRK